MTSLWPAEEVETLVSLYCDLICREDTVIRKKVDQGMWQEVARKINSEHAGKEYHLDKDGKKCADKIELFKSNFRNNKGPCPKELRDIMPIFGHAQPDPEVGQEDVHVNPTNTEINRVARILDKVESREMTVAKAFLEIEGARKVSLENFRKTCRDLTGGVDSDDYGGFVNTDVQKLIKDCRKSYSRIQTLKHDIAVEEEHIDYCEADAFVLLEESDPIHMFLTAFHDKFFVKATVRKSAASLLNLRG